MRMNAARLSRLVAVLAVTIGISYFCYLAKASATVAVMLLLLDILVAAIYTSLWESICASLAAALCLDFFFVPPVLTITVNDLQGWLSLFIFIAVSVLTADLSNRQREQHKELQRRQSETEKLHAFSRAMLLTSGDNVRRLVVNKCIEIFGFEEASLFDNYSGGIFHSQTPGSFPDEVLQRAAICGVFSKPSNSNHLLLPVSLGNKTIGSLGLVGDPLPETTLQNLVSTVAVALAQAQAQEAHNRAQAVRQGEELKSVMIDALAHDLKTPLTVIEAATDMLRPSMNMDAEQQGDLIRVVKQETHGLKKLMEEAIHLAQIDAKKLRLETARSSATDLVNQAMELLGEQATMRQIRVEAQHGLPTISVDRELLMQAIKQLLDNALKYSPADTPINVHIAHSDGLVSISIHNKGRGLTDLEQSKVFDKFYRGRHENSGVQGTGMGLAIAKEIAEAHGGSIAVESQPGEGSRFTVTLRADPEAVLATS
jgi:two-component system, OmpR family, sensor histidine kinase KdpD